MLVRYTKTRHLEAKDTQDIETTLRNKEGSLVWTSSDGDPTYVRCIELVRESISYADIAEELGISKAKISRMKKKAASEGLL